MSFKNVIAFPGNVRNRFYAAQGAAAAGLMATPFYAFAQATDLGGAVEAEVAGGKTSVNKILLGLAAVLGLFLLWSMIKRAK